MQRKYVINALIYVLATLGANYTAAWFIPFPIFGQVAVGTFIFGVTFTQRDKLHSAGRQWVYGTIAFAAFANGGEGVIPYVITEIHSADGPILYRRGGLSLGRVIEPARVAMMNAMMHETFTIGTARSAARCSTGWWVGPSSPSPMESCVIT